MTNNPEQEKRIEEVLEESAVKTVNPETIAIFFDHLNNSLALPCEVIMAGDDEKYLLDEIQNPDDEMYGILGKLCLMTEDAKETLAPLCDIKTVDNRSENAPFLSDFAYWFINAQ